MSITNENARMKKKKRQCHDVGEGHTIAYTQHTAHEIRSVEVLEKQWRRSYVANENKIVVQTTEIKKVISHRISTRCWECGSGRDRMKRTNEKNVCKRFLLFQINLHQE